MDMHNFDINVKPGRYVLAVSGGVDSMVLLYRMATMPGVDVVVAHFDHGIRPDSSLDRQHVEAAAASLNAPFYFAEGHLGPNASEATARAARYDFLRHIQLQTGSTAVVTAHHQDDVLETAILNLLRGTKYRGLISLGTTTELVRPLLDVSKQRIVAYARANNISWREDSTNVDTKYLRNHIRHILVPRLTTRGRREFLQIIQSVRKVSEQLDEVMGEYEAILAPEGKLNRKQFRDLPDPIAREVMARWLRKSGVIGYDHKMLVRLVGAAKTYQTGKMADVLNGYKLIINKEDLALQSPDR